MKFILGKKLEMSQVYGADGNVIPITLVQAGSCVVTQVKRMDQDGYSAVQIGFLPIRKLTKPEEGHLKDLPKLHHLCEFRVAEGHAFKRGDVVEAN
ncbi:MAG: 50S ribosomal protein L3, partial [Candidatus Uhrbacteria bacterium]|nr:50S ribosomal protein L3 [Candidatus Uhrbacteria bacterium]